MSKDNYELPQEVADMAERIYQHMQRPRSVHIWDGAGVIRSTMGVPKSETAVFECALWLLVIRGIVETNDVFANTFRLKE